MGKFACKECGFPKFRVPELQSKCNVYSTVLIRYAASYAGLGPKQTNTNITFTPFSVLNNKCAICKPDVPSYVVAFMILNC